MTPLRGIVIFPETGLFRDRFYVLGAKLDASNCCRAYGVQVVFAFDWVFALLFRDLFQYWLTALLLVYQAVLTPMFIHSA